MKHPRVLIACLTLALVVMTIFGHASSESPDSEPNINEDQGSGDNPCKEVWENTTVSTPQGLILCIVPSDEELTQQLKSIGGYNKHYVAVTQEEAENFEPILPGWNGAATTKPTRPSSTRRCRRKRRGHPSFRKRRRYWNRSVDLKKLGWADEKDEPNSEEDSTKEQIDAKRDDKSAYRRSKRSDQSGIKESNKIGCVQKGETVSGMRQMCYQCQRRTELTEDRFPPYINEVTCEAEDGSGATDGTTFCKPTIGKCAQGVLLIQLLKRTDEYTEVNPPPSGIYFKAFKQIWVEYTHEIRSCCECRALLRLG